MKKYFCLCCGYNTLDKKPPGTKKTCNICYWKDAIMDGRGNAVTLMQAKYNLKLYGFSDFEFKDKVRKPTANDIRHRNWEKLYYPGGKKKSIFTILPERKIETGHWVIDEVGKPAHKEIFYKPAIYIIHEEDRAVYMDFYTINGEWLHDYWHYNFDDAKHQAEYEFGELINNWKEIPDNIENLLEYVLTQISKD